MTYAECAQTLRNKPDSVKGTEPKAETPSSRRVYRFARQRSVLVAGQAQSICTIGRSGVTRTKREGDGATPIGTWRLIGWFARPSLRFPAGAQPRTIIRRDMGWCDEPRHGLYNRRVRLPFAGSHERLWRDDDKYAIVGVLDHNTRPRIKGLGSAIFFHLSDGAPSTAGCIAIDARVMRKLLPRLSRQLSITIR